MSYNKKKQLGIYIILTKIQSGSNNSGCNDSG